MAVYEAVSACLVSRLDTPMHDGWRMKNVYCLLVV
jgi:hypothetical protein